jgi:AraC family transcriptional regulator, regulatory protein of adaptative response / methylated-DNA-[protein]-cysteine methyltransferase
VRRAGGRGETIRHASAETELGRVRVAATARGICAITFGEDDAEHAAWLRRRFPEAEIIPGDAGFAATLKAVVALIERPSSDAGLPLDLRGTAFQERVWAALRAIPPGTTASYAGIAAAIGQPTAARGVASACAANPVAVAVPCHRVVRADGSLSGYRWGVERKAALLAREKPRLSRALSPRVARRSRRAEDAGTPARPGP